MESASTPCITSQVSKHQTPWQSLQNVQVYDRTGILSAARSYYCCASVRLGVCLITNLHNLM